MKLCEVRAGVEGGRVRLTAVSEDAGGKRLPDVWFEYDEKWRDFVRDDADVFVPMMLVGSMMAGERFETDMPVSAMMRGELAEVQAIMSTWFPERLKAMAPRTPNVEAKGAARTQDMATFFSAGVDAYYVALKYLRGEGEGRLTHLIYMEGVEAPLSKMKTGKAARVEEIAGRLGLPVITGRTNVRDCFDYEYLPYVCGPALASSALALSGGLARVRIPSGLTYRPEDWDRESTHPLLDRLWSTEYMEIRTDGAGVTRARKLAYIVSEPMVLENLSVCIVNLGEWGNCSKCHKCVRTMITLQALGMLEKAKGFKSPFDYGLIGTMNLDSPVTRAFFIQNIEFARETGRDMRLVREMEKHLRRWEKYRALVTLCDGTPARRLGRWVKKRL